MNERGGKRPHSTLKSDPVSPVAHPATGRWGHRPLRAIGPISYRNWAAQCAAPTPSDSKRLLGKARRRTEIAPALIFLLASPQWGGRNLDGHSDFARRKFSSILQVRVPRNGGPGAASPCQGEMSRSDRGGRVGDYEHKVLIWSRPRRRFGYFAAAGKVTRRPQAAKFPLRITNPIQNLPPHPPQCAHWGTFPPRGRLI